MNDQGVAFPQLGNDFVHAWSHLDNARRRGRAMMIVPHVADDERGRSRIPLDLGQIGIVRPIDPGDAGAASDEKFGHVIRQLASSVVQPNDSSFCCAARTNTSAAYPLFLARLQQ